MSRKDFELIARVLRANSSETVVRETLALDFADELAATNGRFDRQRFLAACLGAHDASPRFRGTPYAKRPSC